jgi:hypothetical protein
MEDIRTYRSDDEEQGRDDERGEWVAASADDEVPFHIPRD